MTITDIPTPEPATDIYRNESVAGTVERFQRLFNTLSAGNVAGMAEVYSPDIRFTDPFGTVDGLDYLQAHFEKIYANVRSCRFDFSDVLLDGDRACLVWVMYLQHPRLRRGREVTVHGMSHLTIAGGRVRTHRDYFDAGEMLYENLPVFGSFVRRIRRHAS